MVFFFLFVFGLFLQAVHHFRVGIFLPGTTLLWCAAKCYLQKRWMHLRKGNYFIAFRSD